MSDHAPLSLLIYPPAVTLVLTIGYMVSFVTALVANSLVLAVVWRSPAMRNVTSYLLANLAVADIAVAIFVMPITLLSTLFTGEQSSLYLHTYFTNHTITMRYL